ncbi:MAG: four helix bundle protein [Rhodospirillales bacterium]|nr:four helix bundle protein [Acetobacter sp.]
MARQSFRDLQVWHLAIDLTELVYSLTAQFPKHEVFGLSAQMRRAAVSIPSNIAEGSARNSRKDFRNFIAIAKGSACELQTQLLIAERLRYSNETELQNCEALASRVARMLSGLSEALRKPSQPKT